MESAFLQLSVQLMGEQSPEDHPDMLDVLFQGVRVDEDVVKIYKCPTAYHVPQHIVDELLGGCRSIAQTEGHHQTLIVISGSV